MFILVVVVQRISIVHCIGIGISISTIRSTNLGCAACFVSDTAVGLLILLLLLRERLKGSCDGLDCRIVTNSYRVFRDSTHATITVWLLLLCWCLVRSLVLLPFRWWTRSRMVLRVDFPGRMGGLSNTTSARTSITTTTMKQTTT